MPMPLPLLVWFTQSCLNPWRFLLCSEPSTVDSTENKLAVMLSLTAANPKVFERELVGHGRGRVFISIIAKLEARYSRVTGHPFG